MHESPDESPDWSGDWSGDLPGGRSGDRSGDGGAAERRRRFAEEVRSERPDLALLCLLVGAEADPALGEGGEDEAQIELDRLAGLLPFGLATPPAWASALAALLGGQCDFRGSPADYQRLESSLLHEVLRRRRGLPILLSVVWIEVARRAGAPVYGVALPGHFVVGFGAPHEQILADPFAGGRLLTGADTELLVAGATGAPLDPSMLTPADPLEIMVRILNNIRAWAAARPERTDVALWAVELSLLLPSHPARLRYERAQLLVERGEFLAGAAELDAYADVVAAVEPTTAAAIRGRARAARAMLN
ncbi:transglutaminase-like domain-containing protein [Streptomyces sp. NPDC051907]|uniref:transglutaminase-like domain-containing protein n=1 Tax=Streptomyces sp. NPDC051907 TaxID=3155284 RepID=UPI00342A2990